MDQVTHANLVREARFELKQGRRLPSVNIWDATDVDAATPSGEARYTTSRQRMEVARTRSRMNRIRPGETRDGYVGRQYDRSGHPSYQALARRQAERRWDIRRPAR